MKSKYSKEVRELVKQRIKAMPKGITLNFGSTHNLSIKGMIEVIDSGEEIGNEIIEMHLDYLRSLKKMV